MNEFASALSTKDDAATAAREACAAIADALGGTAPDLVVMFATPDLMANAAGMAAIVEQVLSPRALIGCTAEGVVGTAREVEAPPGLSLWAASLPGVDLEPFALEPAVAPDGEVTLSGWPPHVEPAAPAGLASDDAVILLADPFSFPPSALTDAAGLPAMRPVIGGMASGASSPGGHRLLLGGRVMTAGAVGVVVPGAVPLVSQGCRPVGPEMTITACDGGVIHALAGRPALTRLQEVLESLPADERSMAEEGVLAGLVIDGNKPVLEQGDFLIRGIVGGDPQTGAVVVGEHVRVGQVMRLQVRDHASADSDLRAVLASLGDRAGGALLFTCNGRGTRMFPGPDHDALAISDVLGDIPVAGLFCNGEIGPVGGRAYLHGFTSTLAIFKCI